MKQAARRPLRVAGLMSGTSVDGIDVAVAEIDGAPEGIDGWGPLAVRSLALGTAAWPDDLRGLIFDLFAGRATPAVMCRANFMLAERFASAVEEVLAQAGIAVESLDLIGSHGQTIWHDVVDGRVTSTLQIGEPAVIAARCGVTTVGNFRVADVAAGGQGAPLVSAFDWHLLRPQAGLGGCATGWRAVQNIGGIGNVTFLPPLGVEATPLAFDTGPGNALIDWAAVQATAGEWQYDRDGVLGARGQILDDLLAAWLVADAYLVAPPTKTTGRELYSVEFARNRQAEVAAAGGSLEDLVAMFTRFTAASIADAYARFAPGPVAQMVVGGGGARNPTLMRLLSAELAARLGRPIEVVTHEAVGIDADAKEALAFALLAYLCVHGWAGNVPACTGAKSDVVLGEIAPGRNFGTLMRAIGVG